MKFSVKIFFIVSFIFAVFISCNKTKYYKNSNVTLKFSKDTLLFDTIFSGVGSATRYFKVINPYNEAILISDIQLEKGTNSKYRLNINGTAGNSSKNIEIDAKDSIYIFADVTINTDNDDILETDKIVFNTGNNEQFVNLVAFGQDVHFFNDSVIQTQTWSNDKPYLIYNSVALDENQHLTVEAGTHIYSHRNSRIMILGTLTVNGTYENPVIFEADRLNGHSSIFDDIFDNDTTDNYYDVAGQWGGIWLTKLSKDNEINYAHIKNADIGIQVDSVQNGNPQLSIHNSIIEHHSYAGIFAQVSNIFATNCLISDCGYYNIAVTRGGNYNFYHCTIDNHWKGIRNTPAVFINNYYQYNGTVYLYDLENAYFGNCIISGNKETECNADGYSDQGVLFNYQFENCILKIDPESSINTNDITHYKNIILNAYPIYKDYYEYNFMLENNSPAINHGKLSIPNLFPTYLNNDLNNISRINDAAPDIGCYEYQ